MKNLTVAIPTLNEAQDLPRLFNTLDFADQVLIIDSGSTDNTVKIAQEWGADVVHRDFDNFADTRNFADKKARHDWVLALDADVEVPDNLAQEIRNLSEKPAVYRIGRINLIWGRPILHADWSPQDDNHVRLYHKSLGNWQGRVHEQFVTDQKPKPLDNFLIHHNYQSVSEFVRKLNHYSTIKAQEMYQQGQSFSWWRFFKDPLLDFCKRYFYKLGFLDSLHGLFLSLLQAVYHATVQVKLYSLTY